MLSCLASEKKSLLLPRFAVWLLSPVKNPLQSLLRKGQAKSPEDLREECIKEKKSSRRYWLINESVTAKLLAALQALCPQGHVQHLQRCAVSLRERL